MTKGSLLLVDIKVRHGVKHVVRLFIARQLTHQLCRILQVTRDQLDSHLQQTILFYRAWVAVLVIKVSVKSKPCLFPVVTLEISPCYTHGMLINRSVSTKLYGNRHATNRVKWETSVWWKKCIQTLLRFFSSPSNKFTPLFMC